MWMDGGWDTSKLQSWDARWRPEKPANPESLRLKLLGLGLQKQLLQLVHWWRENRTARRRPSASPRGRLISPFSPWWETHVSSARSLQVLVGAKQPLGLGSWKAAIIRGAPPRSHLPLTYLAIQRRPAAPPGGTTAPASRNSWEEDGGWMEDHCFPLLWENDSINSTPPLLLPAPVVPVC